MPTSPVTCCPRTPNMQTPVLRHLLMIWCHRAEKGRRALTGSPDKAKRGELANFRVFVGKEAAVQALHQVSACRARLIIGHPLKSGGRTSRASDQKRCGARRGESASLHKPSAHSCLARLRLGGNAWHSPGPTFPVPSHPAASQLCS